MNATRCFFVSDLHGHRDRYQKLFQRILQERPYAVFLGGDLFPSGLLHVASGAHVMQTFFEEVFLRGWLALRERLGDQYPHVFLLLGNDDGRFQEPVIKDMAAQGLWQYVHNRIACVDGMVVFGYAYVPPTPFRLKDWERYDVSRYVDPGCISPEEGYYSTPVPAEEKRWRTIRDDLEQLTQGMAFERAIGVFHSPPYRSKLDRAALDGQMIDAAPLDVHVGSIAIQRFIMQHRPYITLHGHIHESPRLSGSWQDMIGKTYCFSAAHDGQELALVRFELEHPEQAERELL